MDGRWKRLLAGGVLFGAIGCSHTPKPPVNSSEPPLSRVSASDEKRKDNAPIKVETLLALANVRIQASVDVNRTSAERKRGNTCQRMKTKMANTATMTANPPPFTSGSIHCMSWGSFETARAVTSE